MTFSLLLTRVISFNLDLWEGLDIIILIYLSPFISRVVNFAQHFFLERESWSQPYHEFLIAPQFDHAPKCSIRVWGWGYVKEGLTRSCFHAEILEFQKSFWHWFKANSFWRNSSDFYGEVFRSDEIFFVLLLVKNMKWHLVGKKGLRFNLRGSKNQVFKTFVLSAWIMIWFAWESTAYRSRLLAIDQKGLD